MPESLTIVRRSPTKYGFRDIHPEGTTIIAIHSWDTGFQELCFRNDDHFKRFAKQRGIPVKENNHAVH